MENKLKGGYYEIDDIIKSELPRIRIEEACENNIEDFVSIVYVKGSPRMTEGYYFRMFHNEKECKSDLGLAWNDCNKNKSYGNFMGPITFKNEKDEKKMISDNLYNDKVLLSGDKSYKKIENAAYDMYDFYKNKDLTKRKFPITYTQYKKEILTPTESARDYQIIKHYTGFETCKLDPNRPGYCVTNNSAAAAGGRRKKSVRKSSRSVRKSRKQRKSTRRVRS